MELIFFLTFIFIFYRKNLIRKLRTLQNIQSSLRQCYFSRISDCQNHHTFLRFITHFNYFLSKKNYFYHPLSSKFVVHFKFRLCILLQISISCPFILVTILMPFYKSFSVFKYCVHCYKYLFLFMESF